MNIKFAAVSIFSIVFAALAFFSTPALATSSPAPLAVTFNIPIGTLRSCTISETENNCLGQYLKAWYGFAIGIAGIFATLVIMYGGFKYLTSRGDKGMATKGKDYIVGAATGLSLVFLSYTIVSLVNPNLTVINMPALPSFKDESGIDLTDAGVGSHGAPTTASDSAGQTASKICDGVNGALNSDSSATFPALSIDSSALDKVNAFDSAFQAAAKKYNVSANLLKAIALAESAGNTAAVSGAGACGLMQFMPSTANKTCQELINDPNMSIDLAGQYLANESSAGITDTLDQIAGYNAGTEKSPGRALGPSEDCPGALAWECCIDAGGLSQTQDYVANVSGYYKTLIK